MPKTILIVEDNAKLATSLQAVLLKQGYKTIVESRGDRAVYRIVQEQPDLVILDIMLPGMNGKQVCLTVRDHYKGRILMLTALNDLTTEISSLNLGADDYLAKPIKTELLLARASALLRRPNTYEVSSEIQFGGLHIYLAKKEVKLFSESIALKLSEFELLALLAKNHDQILNRNTIMQALRGRKYDGIDRSIDLRISYLRKKLKDSINNPYRIKTFRGKGYILISSAWEKP